MKLNWTEQISLTQQGVNRIKTIAGVYRLVYYDGGKGGYYIYYVGQAEDLNDRLSQHLPGNEKNACCQRHLSNYSCYLRAAAISQQSDRDGVEITLYNHYKPSCVERIPDVDPININFD